MDGGGSKDIRTLVNHVTAYGLKIREKKPLRAGMSMTKNAVLMREMRKDPEYRRPENERRKERRKVEYEKEKEQKLREIPVLSILSSYANEVEKTVELLRKCIKFTKMWNWFKSLLLLTKNL